MVQKMLDHGAQSNMLCFSSVKCPVYCTPVNSYDTNIPHSGRLNSTIFPCSHIHATSSTTRSVTSTSTTTRVPREYRSTSGLMGRHSILLAASTGNFHILRTLLVHCSSDSSSSSSSNSSSSSSSSTGSIHSAAGMKHSLVKALEVSLLNDENANPTVQPYVNNYHSSSSSSSSSISKYKPTINTNVNIKTNTNTIQQRHQHKDSHAKQHLYKKKNKVIDIDIDKFVDEFGNTALHLVCMCDVTTDMDTYLGACTSTSASAGKVIDVDVGMDIEQSQGHMSDIMRSRINLPRSFHNKMNIDHHFSSSNSDRNSSKKQALLDIVMDITPQQRQEINKKKHLLKQCARIHACILLLLDNGAKANQPNHAGVTPLHYLCANKIFGEFEGTFQERIKSYTKNKDDNDIYNYCNDNGTGKGNDSNKGSNKGSVLQEQEDGDEEVSSYMEALVSIFLTSTPTPTSTSTSSFVNAQDQWGNTPLLISIMHRQWNTARVLLQHGAGECISFTPMLVLTDTGSFFPCSSCINFFSVLRQ